MESITRLFSKDDEARKLAEAHYIVEPDITHIYRIKARSEELENSPEEPIKLLEVNEDTIPTGEVLPFGFAPAPGAGYYYPSIIVMVTPEEFELIRARKLPLPRGWMIGPLLPKPEGNGHG